MKKDYLLRFIQTLNTSAIAFFPLLILASVRFGNPNLVMAIGVVFFILQFFFCWRKAGISKLPFFSGLFGLFLASLSLVLDEIQIFFWYPVLINLILLMIFGFSLLKGPPIVERLARSVTTDLPRSAVIYTRKVTILWCFFFVFNGLIALWTVLENNLYFWSLWNGCLSYICLGCLFLGELIFRKCMLHV